MPNNTESQLLDALLEALNALPRSHARLEAREAPIGAHRIDAVVDAEVAGRPIKLLVECKSLLYPRDAREVVWQLQRLASAMGQDGPPWTPFIAANVVSQGAREILHEEEVGYFDESGSLYLPAPGVFLLVDKPSSKGTGRKVGLIFRGRRAQVLHAVWDQGREWFGVHQIAESAMTSPTTASQTLSTAERQGWLESRGAGPAKERRLVDPQGLLEAWAKYQRSAPKPRLRRYFVPAGGTQDIIRRIDTAFGDRDALYEITGEAAAQHYAPYLSSISQVRCRMIDAAASQDALRAMDARPVQEGWNLGVLDAASEGEFAFRQRDLAGWFASPLKVYLDLLQGAGRSSEMAAHLRETRLQ